MERMETNRVLVDTSILIRHFRSRERHTSIFRQAIRRYDLYLSVITAYEIEFGAVRAGRLSDLEIILPYVEVLPIGLETAIKASELHATLIRRNQDIGIKDVLIAATCLAYDLPILTYNQAHFYRTPVRVIESSSF